MKSVFAGDQLIVTPRSEPNARCVFYLSGDAFDLSQETTVDGAGNLFWIVTIPEDTPVQLVEFSMDCGGGEALGSVEAIIEASGNHQIMRDEPRSSQAADHRPLKTTGPFRLAICHRNRLDKPTSGSTIDSWNWSLRSLRVQLLADKPIVVAP
jgi:hypothetical protein